MIARLLDRLERPFTFVVGKGGVGKTTTAAGLALALADRGDRVRLVSTDPAHSLADLFDAPADGPSPCTPRLVLEEIDAVAQARRVLEPLEPGLREIMDRGTYLDEEDTASLLEGSLPGLDEIGAVLRLQELAADGGWLVVDTAPTGHTLRMLDAARVVEGWIGVFEAMAAKADTVASALVGRAVRFSGESALEDLGRAARAFTTMLERSDFVVVTGPGAVVAAETDRLIAALGTRGLRVAATAAARRPGARADVLLPLRPGLGGCEALRSWIAAGADEEPTPAVGGAHRREPAGAVPRAPPSGEPATASAAVLELLERELVVFAGKGGVGKTTSAAAAAVLLAGSGPVLLAGADPAGSLADVLPDPPEGLAVREADAEGELERFRAAYRDEVEGAFRAIGLDTSARMDRAVVESLWGLAPPGLDEIVAVARLAADEEEEGAAPRRTVLDTAPTGHFLRLAAMPELTRDWVRRLMRILLKYRALGGLDAPAEPLVRFARRLRALQERLSDPSRTAIIIVTLDEPLVRAETRRLLDRLRAMGLAPAALLVNRAGPEGAVEAAGLPLIRAPELDEPTGAAALRALGAAWERVA